MKPQKNIELNQSPNSLIKKRVKIIKLNNKQKNSLSLFSQSLYLTNFLYNKLKKNNSKIKTYLNRSALIIPKNTPSIFPNKFQNSNNIYINNYFQTLKQSANNTNPNSCQNKGENNEHKLLYENNIKLQNNINKLKAELLYLKSMCVKKDEEIKDFTKYIEEAKLHKKKHKNLFMKMILKENEIIKLKDIYENIKLKFREENDKNNYLTKKMKGIDIDELTNDINEDETLLKEKVNEYREKNYINKELLKEVEKSSWKKHKFLDNYNLVKKLKHNINNKILNVEELNDEVYFLRQKCKQIKSEKYKMIRHNYYIKKDNIRLINDKRYRNDCLLRKEKIETKILSFEKKTQDLIEQVNEKELFIKKLLNSQKKTQNENNRYYEYTPKLEPSPFDKNEERQIIFYESLIKESKERQNNLVKIINDLINNKTDSKIIDNNSSRIFDENMINSDMNDIQINFAFKDEKMSEFIFLLNVAFYIRNITKEKILSILLNIKTENYYIGNLQEKNNFIYALAEEILNKINNRQNINELKDIILYLFETKYSNDIIQFLNKVINDIYILDNKYIILFNQEQENILFQKLEMIYFYKINSLNKKIKLLKKEKILYQELKQIFEEEKLYIKENKEKMKIFQFFIYILKKRENNFEEDFSLFEFDVKNIFEFLNEINSREDEIKIKNKEFIEALKIMLKVKNKSFDEFFGTNKNIYITEFVDILNENNFEIENNDLDFEYYLGKYKKEENSEEINIKLLKKDLIYV